MCTICPNRRTVSFGIAALIASPKTLNARPDDGSAGCSFFLSAGSSELSQKGFDRFPGLRRAIGNSTNTLAAISLELNFIFGIMAPIGFYDDTADGPDGNAGATDQSPWPVLGGLPPPDGIVALGAKCYDALRAGPYQTVAVAAVCAHEVGHLLQYKYVNSDLYALRNRDRSVVRTELHADYVCGYYAAIRKLNQPDWPAVMQALNQFKFGDEKIANPVHHGTPKDRGDAVQSGFLFGAGGHKTPDQVARAGLEYVARLNLQKT